MLKRILTDPSLQVILLNMDYELAEKVCAGGCPWCGGVLHSARFPRKPRCGRELGPEWHLRLSFCCANKGCRRRSTPPSVRFLRRRLYPTIVIILVTALSQGITSRRRRTLEAAFGVDRRTLMRWRRWWQEVFSTSAFWRNARARFLPQLASSTLPGSLIERFGPLSRDRLIALLRFLEPVSF